MWTWTQVMWTGLMLPENDWNRGKIVIDGGPDSSWHGAEVTCAEFQNLAGRASAKNWKTSVRKLESHGEPGLRMGHYLREQAKQYGRGYVGRTLSHYWSKERQWFQATVVSYEEKNGAHLLRYAVDGESHWVYLCMEEFKVGLNYTRRPNPFWTLFLRVMSDSYVTGRRPRRDRGGVSYEGRRCLKKY